jgi:hypothetical protein
VLQVLEEFVSLVVLGNDLDDLVNIVVGSELHGTNVALDEVVLEVHGESLNLLGPGSREKEGLSVGSDLRDNLSDLGLETHVEHSVGFVHDEVGDSLEVGSARLEHINQSTGGSDTDLDTLREISDLRTLGGTTVNGSVSDSRRFTKLGAFLLNLNSEFSSGGKNEDDGTIASGEERLSVDVDHGGESKRNGLSGTSLGDGNDISTRESHGPSLTLDRSGSIETHGSDLGHDILGETGLVKGRDGSGDVFSLNLGVSLDVSRRVSAAYVHALESSEIVNLLLRSSSDSSVLDVEAGSQFWPSEQGA